MASLKTGSICSLRGTKDEWVVINEFHDGIVKKFIIQSRNSGIFKRVFAHELFEKYTSTYQDVNKFLMEVTGQGLEDDFIFDEVDDHEMANMDIGYLMERPVIPVESEKKRFKSVSLDDIQDLRDKNQERSTKNSTKWAVKLLNAWMTENHHYEALEDMSAPILDMILQQFYASLINKQGQHYSRSALVGIRAGLNRHLTSPPYSRLINLMKDREFMVSNQVLSGMIKGLKREGHDKAKHKEPITPEDHEKLYKSDVFNLDKPDTLQNKVLYELISQFGRRGREGLASLKKTSFEIKRDSKERRYLTMAYNEADKTHHGMDSREIAKEPRMYAETNNKFCPLTSFEKLISKLHPECDRLFQRPGRNFQSPNTTVWFEKSPQGVHKLNNFMSKISVEANLSKRYTNHCIRAFVSTQLQNKGYSNESIMAVTGHRNVQSLNSYIKPHDDERHSISRALCYKGEDSQIQIQQQEDTESESIIQPSQIQTSVSSVSNMNVTATGPDVRIFAGAVQAGTINVNIYNNKE